MKLAIVNRVQTFFINYEYPLTVRVDSSERGCGGVLIQTNPLGIEEVIMFISLTYSLAAHKWSNIEQEAYALIMCLLKLYKYLIGHHFFLETDHKNLLWLNYQSAPKLIRWRLRIQEFDYTLIHIPGKTNIIADTLSRCMLCIKHNKSVFDILAISIMI